MMPSLSDKDRAAIETTAKQSGLTSAQPAEATRPAAATPPKSVPKQPRSEDKKALRVSVAPSSDLADAIGDKIETLSPDAQKYVSTATLLREFINEHDARLAQMFREKHGL